MHLPLLPSKGVLIGCVRQLPEHDHRRRRRRGHHPQLRFVKAMQTLTSSFFSVRLPLPASFALEPRIISSLRGENARQPVDLC